MAHKLDSWFKIRRRIKAVEMMGELATAPAPMIPIYIGLHLIIKSARYIKTSGNRKFEKNLLSFCDMIQIYIGKIYQRSQVPIVTRVTQIH